MTFYVYISIPYKFCFNYPFHLQTLCNQTKNGRKIPYSAAEKGIRDINNNIVQNADLANFTLLSDWTSRDRRTVNDIQSGNWSTKVIWIYRSRTNTDQFPGEFELLFWPFSPLLIDGWNHAGHESTNYSIIWMLFQCCNNSQLNCSRFIEDIGSSLCEVETDSKLPRTGIFATILCNALCARSRDSVTLRDGITTWYVLVHQFSHFHSITDDNFVRTESPTKCQVSDFAWKRLD